MFDTLKYLKSLLGTKGIADGSASSKAAPPAPRAPIVLKGTAESSIKPVQGASMAQRLQNAPSGNVTDNRGRRSAAPVSPSRMYWTYGQPSESGFERDGSWYAAPASIAPGHFEKDTNVYRPHKQRINVGL